MQRLRLVIVSWLALVVSCEPSLGPPSQLPAPTVDAFAPLRTPGPRSPRIANYRITATLDDERHSIDATQVLTFTNTSSSTLSELSLQLYLNGFENESTVLATSSAGQHRTAPAGSDGWGWIDVSSIRVHQGDGTELRSTARYVGPDHTVMNVPLAQPLVPGATVSLDLAFTSQLPKVWARTGYAGAFTMVGQWFPKVGVLVGPVGQEQWSTQPFHVNTEFFADFGTYDVELTVPSTHVVAATGVLTAVVEHGATRTLTYRAEDVHDFAWMADPYMRVLTAQANVGGPPVEVRVYYRPAHAAFAKRHLAAGVGAIEEFSARFGAYPWPLMSIIDPPLDAVDGAGGMEYPMLVTTSGDTALARPGMRLPEYVTIHEIGHNWFQGMLASDERAEAWLDEGVNEWADGVVMAALYGERSSALDWYGFSAELFRLRRAYSEAPSSLPVPIATAAAAFPDFESYGLASYDSTMQTLRTVELAVGRDAFAAGMRRYASEWAFRHPTGNDLRAALTVEAGPEVARLLDPALHELGGVQLRLRNASCTPAHLPRGRFVGADGVAVIRTDAEQPSSGSWRCNVFVENLGPVPVPVDIKLRFADGTSQTSRWTPTNGQHWHKLELERSSKLVRVQLDPNAAIGLQDQPLELDLLVDDHDTKASYRAAARVGFWTQGLMSGVGL